MSIHTLIAASQPIDLGGPIIGGEGSGAIARQVEAASTNEGFVAIFTTQLSNIIGFMTVLGGVFFLIYFLVAGFEWLRAGGDTAAVTKAQSRMTNAAIGLLIMILATGIVGIVGGVFGLDLLNPGEIFLNLIPQP